MVEEARQTCIASDDMASLNLSGLVLGSKINLFIVFSELSTVLASTYSNDPTSLPPLTLG